MRFVALSLVSLVSAAALAGTDSLRQSTPFGTATPARIETNTTPGLATLELVGIAVIDKQPRFGLRDVGTNRAYWMGLNEEQDGLTIVAYNSAQNTATVQGRGGSRMLVLKNETITSAAPAPMTPSVQAPAAPMQPRPTNVAASAPRPVPQPEPVPANLTPEQVKQRQAETEARMLVSDLMEISMQERARYAEEQRKRAAGQTSPVPPAGSPK